MILDGGIVDGECWAFAGVECGTMLIEGKDGVSA